MGLDLRTVLGLVFELRRQALFTQLIEPGLVLGFGFGLRPGPELLVQGLG